MRLRHPGDRAIAVSHSLYRNCGASSCATESSSIDPETGQTGNSRYFAGGDCSNGGREVVDAVADGKRAARAILKIAEAAYA